MSQHDGTDDRQILAANLAQALPQLTPEQIGRVSPHFKRASYRPGEVIIRQNDPPQRFYIVVSGRAEVSHEDASGNSHIVDECTAGHYFGEMGLLKDRPRTATVRAAPDEAVEALVLEREDFLALVDESRATEAQVTQDLIRHMINLANFQS